MPRRIRPIVSHPMALRELRVLRLTDVTPALRRVTFTGEQLGAFSPTPGLELPEFASTGFDDDVRLIFPYPGETEPVLPTYQDGKLVSARDPRPLGRYYTVRRWDAETRELDIDFVKHGVGVAATWAYRAEPGDRLHLGGPSGSLGLPEGVDWMLVLGDDTAAPAIARLLDELPDDARAQVFIEVAEAAHRQPLRELPGVEITWLYRGDAPAGGDSLLLEAARAASWWDGEVFAWVAGEQSAVRDIRRHLVEEREVPKTSIDFVGYWKRTEVTALAADPALPENTDEDDDPEEKFHHLTALLPPLAIRLAVGLGLGDLISRGVTTAAALAERTGTDERALRKFLRYLETIDLVARETRAARVVLGVGATEHYRLTEMGEELADDWIIGLMNPKGRQARLERGFFGLEESLRTGRASFEQVTGQGYEELRRDEAFEREFLDAEADGAEYFASHLASSATLAGIRHLALHSDIAGALAALLVERYDALRVTIVASAAQAAWLRDDLERTIPDAAERSRVAVAEQAVTEPVPGVDAVLVVDLLKRFPDSGAAALLRRLAEGLAEGASLLVYEESLDPDDVDDHDAEADLLNLTLHGSGYRTAEEVEAVIAASGLVVAAAEPLGWDDVLRTLAAPA